MAIRLKNIYVDRKRIKDMKQVETAERVRKLLRKEGIEVDIAISSSGSNRWYGTDDFTQLINNEL